MEPNRLKEHLKIRPLEVADFGRGYLTLLSQLTKVGDVSKEAFQKQFEKMRSSGSYYVTVIEDCNTNKVVGTATLFTEYKMVHNARKRGRVEDVVVDDEYRGQKLGNVLIETLKKLAVHEDCYKLTLDCNDEMIAWYNRFGFIVEPGRSNFLTIRLES